LAMPLPAICGAEPCTGSNNNALDALPGIHILYCPPTPA
jgi:hypothetical protein